MAIDPSDIHFRLSGGSVGAANTDPANALGGPRTATSIASDTTQNIFDNITGTESRDGATEYRCFFVYNTHATLTLSNARIWFATSTTSGDDEVDMALGDVAVGTSSEQLIGTAYTAPSNPVLDFEHPTSSGTALVIGDIPALSHQGIWFRRTVNAGAGAHTNNTFSWTVEGESQ